MGTRSKKRVEELQALLRERDWDGALYAVGASFVYLADEPGLDWQRTSVTGDPSMKEDASALRCPDALLWVPKQGEARIIATPRRAAGLYGCGLPVAVYFLECMPDALHMYTEGGRIAVGEPCSAEVRRMLAEARLNIRIEQGEDLCQQLRMMKDEDEIARLRAAAELTDRAMGNVLSLLRPGVTAREVERYLANFGLSNGAQDISFPPTVHMTPSGGQSTAGQDKDAPMEWNTAIAFDFGYVVGGYCSDFGRSFYVGTPSDRLKAAYRALQYAQVSLLASIRPCETRIGDLFGIVLKAMEEHGAGEWLQHKEKGMLGHQIGLDCHEAPIVMLGEDTLLRPGMVMCIEPKVWLPGEGYLRVEDMVLITPTGAESLTSCDRNLFVL